MPPGIIKKSVFVPGGAFRQQKQYRNEGKKLRYFFILNKFPENDDQLVIVTATTKIEKTLKHSFRKALVIVTKKEYSELQERSLINCAWPEEKSKSELVAAIEAHKIVPLSPLPRIVLERLREAIGIATTVTPRIKRLVLGSEETADQAPSGPDDSEIKED